MAIPTAEWLFHAQRLAVGASARVRHNREATPAMTVKNLPDRWTAYCHRCHQGAVQLKSHAVLSRVPDQERFMPWPDDAKTITAWPMYVQETLHSLLLSKGFDWQAMAPDVPLWYSEKQGRLLFGTRKGWIGRATRGQLPKWAGYGFPAPVYGAQATDPILPYVVLTEDFLSALKVRWAVRGELPVSAHAVLGTTLRPGHLTDLLEAGCKGLLVMMDGDKAGDKGAQAIVRRARGLGLGTWVVQCPRDNDPKDLDKQEIIECLNSSGLNWASAT